MSGINANKNILIVEDETQISRFLQLELEHENYSCTTCADGREALELAVARDFDLIILDVMLPSLNGIEVLRRLRQTKQTPVIILTAPKSFTLTQQVSVFVVNWTDSSVPS